MADRFVFYSAAAVGSRHCRPGQTSVGVWGSAKRSGAELVTKTRTNEKVVWESGCEHLLKGYRGEIAQRLMNTASVVEQQVFRNRI